MHKSVLDSSVNGRWWATKTATTWKPGRFWRKTITTPRTLVVSVLPVRHWAEFLNDATLTDSILDRLVKSSHRLEMDGPSMRDKAQYGAIPRIKRD